MGNKIKEARDGIKEVDNWKFGENNSGIAGEHSIEPLLKYK